MLWVSPSFVSSVRHDDCLNLLYQAWFLEDGVLAGTKSSLLRALTIIQDKGPSLCIFISLSKCGSHTTLFPDSMKASHSPNVDILGAPIGDYIHSAKLFAYICVEALKLLFKLDNVAIIDPQVAFNLLRVCASFCRLAHIARSTPPSLSSSLSAASLDQACTTSGVLCVALKAPHPRRGLGTRWFNFCLGACFFSMNSVVMAPRV